MDPQQRLLLEVAGRRSSTPAWPPTRSPAADTGVFVGITTTITSSLLIRPAAALGRLSGTGNGATCIPAGRLSYFLGLEGPSIARRYGVLLFAGRRPPRVPEPAVGSAGWPWPAA